MEYIEFCGYTLIEESKTTISKIPRPSLHRGRSAKFKSRHAGFVSASSELFAIIGRQKLFQTEPSVFLLLLLLPEVS